MPSVYHDNRYLAAATVHRTYEIAILIEPSVVNIDSYVMKGMSNGHDRVPCFWLWSERSVEIRRDQKRSEV